MNEHDFISENPNAAKWLLWAARLRAELDRVEATRVMLSAETPEMFVLREMHRADFEASSRPQFIAAVEFLQRRLDYVEKCVFNTIGLHDGVPTPPVRPSCLCGVTDVELVGLFPGDEEFCADILLLISGKKRRPAPPEPQGAPAPEPRKCRRRRRDSRPCAK